MSGKVFMDFKGGSGGSMDPLVARLQKESLKTTSEKPAAEAAKPVAKAKSNGTGFPTRALVRRVPKVRGSVAAKAPAKKVGVKVATKSAEAKVSAKAPAKSVRAKVAAKVTKAVDTPKGETVKVGRSQASEIKIGGATKATSTSVKIGAAKPAGVKVETAKPAGVKVETAKPAGTKVETAKPAGTRVGVAKTAGVAVKVGATKPVGTTAAASVAASATSVMSLSTKNSSAKNSSSKNSNGKRGILSRVNKKSNGASASGKTNVGVTTKSSVGDASSNKSNSVVVKTGKSAGVVTEKIDNSNYKLPSEVPKAGYSPESSPFIARGEGVKRPLSLETKRKNVYEEAPEVKPEKTGETVVLLERTERENRGGFILSVLVAIAMGVGVGFLAFLIIK